MVAYARTGLAPSPRQALPHLRDPLSMSQNSSSGPPSNHVSKPAKGSPSDTGTPEGAPTRLQHLVSQSTLQSPNSRARRRGAPPTRTPDMARTRRHSRQGRRPAAGAAARYHLIPLGLEHVGHHAVRRVAGRPRLAAAHASQLVGQVGGLRAVVCGTPWLGRQTRPDHVEQPARGIRHSLLEVGVLGIGFGRFAPRPGSAHRAVHGRASRSTVIAWCRSGQYAEGCRPTRGMQPPAGFGRFRLLPRVAESDGGSDAPGAYV